MSRKYCLQKQNRYSVHITIFLSNPPKSQQPKYPLWAHSLDESLDVCGSFYDFTCAQYQRENRPTKQESFGRLTDHIKLVRRKQSGLLFFKIVLNVCV